MLGRYPYENEPESTATFEEAIVTGLRPQLPQCHPDLAKLIQECWQDDAEKRPSMAEVLERIEKTQQELMTPHEDAKQQVDELPEPVKEILHKELDATIKKYYEHRERTLYLNKPNYCSVKLHYRSKRRI